MTENTNSSHNQPVVDVLAWICIKDRCVLGTRTRGNDVFYMPGGKREPGESDWHALAREVQEELNVILVPETLTKMITIEESAHGYSQPTQVRMKCFQADHVGKPVPNSEIEEVIWLSYTDLNRCAPAAQRVLEHLYEHQLIE